MVLCLCVFLTALSLLVTLTRFPGLRWGFPLPRFSGLSVYYFPAWTAGDLKVVLQRVLPRNASSRRVVLANTGLWYLFKVPSAPPPPLRNQPPPE